MWPFRYFRTTSTSNVSVVKSMTPVKEVLECKKLPEHSRRDFDRLEAQLESRRCQFKPFQLAHTFSILYPPTIKQ